MTIGKFKEDFFLRGNDSSELYLFMMPGLPDDADFGFASQFEDIGHVDKHDVRLKNATKVLILSEPAIAEHPTLGPLWVTKIRADVSRDYHTIIKEFWVPTNLLIKLDDER